jgi:uncharacterized protein YjbI with pentapeptide repeats
MYKYTSELRADELGTSCFDQGECRICLLCEKDPKIYTFENTRVEDIRFENTRFENTHFENTRFENTHFENTRFENTRFENTRL